MATIEQAIRAYINIRDEKKALEKKQAEEIRPLNAKLERIEVALLRALNKQGVESTRTDSGTAYKTLRTSVKVVDWEAALSHIREHELWHMLDHRISKTAVEEYINQSGESFPGADITQELRVNVRR